MMRFLGLPLLKPDPLLLTVYTNLVVAAVVVGSALAWRLTGLRKFVSLLVSALILISVAASSQLHSEDRRAEAPQARVEAIKKTDQFQGLVRQIDLAEKDLAVLTDRTAQIPGDYSTEYRANETAKTDARNRLESLQHQQDQLLSTSEKASTSTPISSMLTDLWSFVFSVVLSITLELLALVLTWKSSKSSVSVKWFPRLPWSKLVIPKDELEYLRAAVATGKGRVLGGYRKAAEHLDCSHGIARGLMEKCQKHGYIRARVLRVRLPKESSLEEDESSG
jgi:hypothetical protein